MNQIVVKDVAEFGARLKVLARGLERARQLRMKEVASREALVNFLLNNVELIQQLAEQVVALDKENTNLERELVSLERDLRELKRATFTPSETSGANHTSEGVSRSVIDEELLCGAERSGAKSVRDASAGGEAESDASAQAVPDTKVTTRNKSYAAKKSVKEV